MQMNSHLTFIRGRIIGEGINDSRVGYNDGLPKLEKLHVNLSKQLNLAVITGNLTGVKSQSKFVELAKSIKNHFVKSNLLNIYINLDSYDVKGMSDLFSICPVINEVIENENYITVYWNTMKNEGVTKVAGYFKERLACDLQLCDI